VKSRNLCMSCSALIVALGDSDRLSAMRDSIKQFCPLHCMPAARPQETNRDAILRRPVDPARQAVKETQESAW
jgi:hypothetical protein